MDTRKETLMAAVQRAKKHIEDMGHEVAHISIYGSQNYELDIYTDEYTSDVDYKAIIVPTLWDLVNNSAPKSTTYEFEGGQIDLKDIRAFMETLVKCNPAYIETLYSEFAYSSPEYMQIIDLRHDLVNEMKPFFAKAAYGMCLEKQKALCHPYPTIKNKIDKWGYDPKQLHHIWRLYDMMEWLYKHNDLRFIPDNKSKEFLLDLKFHIKPVKRAVELAESGTLLCRDVRDKFMDTYEPKFHTKMKVINLSKEIIYNSIVKGVKSSS